jgi:hypothetical protein
MVLKIIGCFMKEATEAAKEPTLTIEDHHHKHRRVTRPTEIHSGVEQHIVATLVNTKWVKPCTIGTARFSLSRVGENSTCSFAT